MEHILVSNIMKHLEGNNILHDLQHGFRANRSCETQLLGLVDDLARHSDRRDQVDVIVMDFAKAFDKVPHRRLLYKLQYYGINGKTNKWIESFLTNRSQQVVLDGEMSDPCPVDSGVPQGTVLGPALFLAYINDLAENISPQSSVRLFADDCIVYRPVKTMQDCEELQNDINKIGEWENTWQMKFNADKCNALKITRARSPLDYKYKLHDHTLEEVDSSKYLGVTIQNDLKWNQHVSNTSGKATKVLNLLRRNIRTNDKEVKDRAYKTMVRPILEYASPVWDPNTKSDSKKLERVQSRAARYVTNRYHNTSSVTDMRQTLNWQTLEERRRQARTVMFYKIHYGLVALLPTAHHLLPFTRMSRHYHPLAYQVMYASTNAYKFSFFPRTVLDWNALPYTLVLSPTVEEFKSGLAAHWAAQATP